MKMSMKLKKGIALFLAVVMSIASTQISALAMITPRVAVQISMSTDVDQLDDVRPNTEITATVTWKSVLASAGEPITIQVSNGAEILINNEADVAFKANGVSAAIKSVNRNDVGDVVTFTSGRPATSPLENDITFKIKAPSTMGDFNMSVKIGSESTPNNPLTNYSEREFFVSPLTVETTRDVIDDVEPFEVFGEAV